MLYAALIVPVSMLGFWGAMARAQTSPIAAPVKSYYYPSIATAITVNPDSTLRVTETQTFAFNGSFHAADRDISLQKVSGITDVSVTDVTTGQRLTQVASPINGITDPSAWGKFAVWKDTNANTEDVEWYFNLDNATHTWAVSYTVHGAVEFDQAYDRLYWNVFSGYSVPVERATVNVTLPQAVPDAAVSETSYRTSVQTAQDAKPSYAAGTFSFAAGGFSGGDAYTIDVTWPKGLVSQQAFWRDWIMLYLPGIVMAGILILCLLAVLWWWLFAVKFRERRGNIIPQYEPPEGLRPAVAEVVSMERVTSKSFAATIVDLAVRGFVRIEEDASPGIPASNVISIIIGSVFAIVAVAYGGQFVVAALATGARGSWSWISSLLGVGIFAVFGVGAFISIRKGVQRKDYRISSLKDFASDAALKDYEKHYLSLLFSIGNGTSVSTKDFKKLMGYAAQQFHRDIMALRKEIAKEANVETGAFSEFHLGSANMPWNIAIVALFLLYPFLLAFGMTWPVAIGVSAMGIATATWTIVRMTRRTAQGRILRDEWLGFKLYLEVAEKYQLQNLTPDLFEKYLPYAMVFGMEKRWAQVFERANITLAAPQWYGGPGTAAMMAGGAGAAPASFSAAAFSSGFSASFSSAIASSIGGGAHGGAGGGGAGGGGGGGGGGAR